MKIESNDKSIEELLSSRFFTIPRFQRPYSWEPEQVVEFWSDITANFGEQYFIGSMVGFRIDKLSLGIVDGQQRLTTITLLLCSIRDAFKELEQTDAAIGTHTFIERTTKDNKKRYVLRTETSFPYLQEHILKDDEAELDEKIGSEEASLKRAFEIFLVKIRAKFVSIDRDSTIVKGDKLDEKISFLNELRDRVLALNVILVELEDEDDAYLIFETLNTRGKDLALSDLLKNHFNRLIKAKGDVDPPNEKWREVLELLEGAPTPIPVDNFIMHYWQSRYGFVSKAKVFKEAKQKIKSNNAKTELNSIVNDAKSYRKVFDTGFNWKKDQAKVTQSLKALLLFRVTQPSPALLSLVRAYRADVIKFSKLVTALRHLENFHFAFNPVTSSRSSGGISAMYSSFARELFAAKSPEKAAKAISSLRKKLQERYPSDDEFDAGFQELNYTKWNRSNRNIVRYILMKVMAEEGHPHVGKDEDLTIEHLIPQSTAGNKLTHSTIGSIGNLILVDQETNKKLGTKGLKQKLKILEQNGYSIPEEFKGKSVLTSKDIRRRTRQISEIARSKIWTV